jgi:hypothetical protein
LICGFDHAKGAQLEESVQDYKIVTSAAKAAPIL